MIEDIKITAIMTVPRVGFNEHWGCVLEALRPWGIPVRKTQGAFWGQCMQNGFQACVDEELDWLLTMDYDTLFTRDHVDTLFGIFGSRPDIDALAAMQPRRNSGMPLMTVERDGVLVQELECDGSPIKCRTAHFGLTLIRVSSLLKTEKPWFFGQPDKNGGWEESSRTDPDIWFWRQWEKAGNTIYVTPNARVGHLEMMVSELDENLNRGYMRVPEWRKKYVESKSKSKDPAMAVV